MMKAVSIGAVAALGMLSACGAKHGVDTMKVAELARSEVASVVADYNAHDADKTAAHDEAGYASMFHGAPNAIGPAADAAAMRVQFVDPAAKMTVKADSVEVSDAGDIAIYHATYRYEFTDPKTHIVMAETGNWIAALKPQPDGKLKLAWSIGADTGPPVPAAPAT